LIALGGGRHVLTLGARLAEDILARQPRARVRIACGFSGGRQPRALAAAEWVTTYEGLGAELSRATVAVVAGGVTLYEACAIGVPVVTLSVAQHQAITTRRIALWGAAYDAGSASADAVGGRRVGSHVASLLGDPGARGRLARAGRQLVDGRGVFRVAGRVRALALASRGDRYAA
jgi:hypothetical protein